MLLILRETAVYNRSQIHTITLVKESRILDELPERKEKKKKKNSFQMYELDSNKRSKKLSFSSNISDSMTEFTTIADLNS
jgi:hypothetical protein